MEKNLQLYIQVVNAEIIYLIIEPIIFLLYEKQVDLEFITKIGLK